MGQPEESLKNELITNLKLCLSRDKKIPEAF